MDKEYIVEKSLPNSFAHTNLLEILQKFPEKKNLIVAGLMTHMCVASTVSSAIDHGYTTTLIASTTTTRDLRSYDGQVIPASTLKASTLSALQDRFATILDEPEALMQYS